MKLVTASQMRSVEKTAIENYGIPGIVLMEHAGKSLSLKCIEMMNQNQHLNEILIFT